MLIKIERFGGEQPGTHPRLLSPMNAQIARNCKLWRGKLSAWLQPLFESATAFSTILSIYEYLDTFWLQSSVDLNIVKGPIADDPHNRLYITGMSPFPRLTDDVLIDSGGLIQPADTVQLGTVAPTGKPGVALQPLANSGTVLDAQPSLGSVHVPNSTTPSQTLEITTNGDPLQIFLQITTKSTVIENVQSHDIRVRIRRGSKIVAERVERITVQGLPGEPNLIRYSIGVNGLDAPPAGTHTYTFEVEDDFVVTTQKEWIITGFAQYDGRLELTLNAGHGLLPGDRIIIRDIEGGDTEVEDLNVTPLTILEVNGQEVWVQRNIGTGTYVSGGVWEQVFDDEDKEDRAYVYTYVADLNGLEMEGAPSPPSDLIAVGQGQAVRLSGFVDAPSGSYTITKLRIYRTATGNDLDADFQFVAELDTPPFASQTHDDKLKNAALGEILPSADWLPPPADMLGLIDLPEGGMAGFSGKTLCFAEPNHPHAWPLRYRRNMHDPIVWIGAFGSSICVATQGRPSVLTGHDPATMAQENLEILQPCLSKRGSVDMGYAVAYPSDDGLVLVAPGRAVVITNEKPDGRNPLFTKDDWMALNPASFVAARWNDMYVAFYDNGEEKAGFILDPKNPFAALTFIDLHAAAAWNDPANGDLYLVIGDEIVKWDAGISFSEIPYVWRSKLFVTPLPLSFAACMVEAEQYPVRIAVYADGEILHTQKVFDAEPFRLPGESTHTHWQIELTGQHVVEGVYMAETMGELTEHIPDG